MVTCVFCRVLVPNGGEGPNQKVHMDLDGEIVMPVHLAQGVCNKVRCENQRNNKITQTHASVPHSGWCLTCVSRMNRAKASQKARKTKESKKGVRKTSKYQGSSRGVSRPVTQEEWFRRDRSAARDASGHFLPCPQISACLEYKVFQTTACSVKEGVVWGYPPKN